MYTTLNGIASQNNLKMTVQQHTHSPLAFPSSHPHKRCTRVHVSTHELELYLVRPLALLGKKNEFLKSTVSNLKSTVKKLNQRQALPSLPLLSLSLASWPLASRPLRASLLD